MRLVGIDALSMADRLLMEAARMIREDFLHQNAFDDIDTYTSLDKQFRLLDLILHYSRRAQEAMDAGADLERLIALPAVESISRAKRIAEDNLEEFDALCAQVDEQVAAVGAGNEAPQPETED